MSYSLKNKNEFRIAISKHILQRKIIKEKFYILRKMYDRTMSIKVNSTLILLINI
jgi:hypothetical protein